ncbi:MAG: hypothetical protein HKUEN01_33920 [Candidatus Kuenenia stuttgartiensis]|uniref:glycosyltransferase family 2 protein n=1 Tax=Kuenenia stuttgartiensis TaxID=174633 RepID=UPI001469B858|nr:glycosyltransferase family 2 protein [Candidatus Kuenenia stuttgartiensis]GJQ51006.1 MAG: hypothetical protein HKUEN01_33920 [Candidatus Kuenenia stuttgartiensis]
MSISLSIIIPALNEEKHVLEVINSCLKIIDKLSLDGEIIVVNDGSTDKTREIIEEAMKQDSRIRIVNHDTNQGLGKSYWTGIDHSSKDAVVGIPGDNENDPWEILRYYKLLEHVDIVIPFVFNKEARTSFRNILSWAYRVIINSTFTTNLNYTNGTVLYRKSILQELEYRSDGFFFQTDVLVRLIKRGYLFAEVPYRLDKRLGGVSKAVGFPSFVQVVKGYLRLVRDHYFKKEKSRVHDGTLTANRHNRIE